MNKAESRFAHCEGITDITTTADGSRTLTCGSDGDIRIWQNFDDDDPVTFSASDSCLSILVHEETVYAGTENHTIESFELSKGKPLGIKAKFTAGVNHIDISRDGVLLVGGSGDMSIQLILLNDSSIPIKKIEAAHNAPILSVAIDPLCKYVATSGCDGCVCIWSINITTSSISTTLVKKWENIFSKTSDVQLSPTLCRLVWSPADGKQIAFPNNSNQLVMYSREKWTQEFTLTHKGLTKLITIVRFSSCEKYIAAGGAEGSIIVWDLETKSSIFYTNVNNSITGLTFTKSNIGLYLADACGRFLHVRNFCTTDGTQNGVDEIVKSVTVSSEVDVDEKDVFDDDMDDLFDTVADEDDDDENSISISKIKADVGFIDDEYVGVDKASKGVRRIDDDDDTNSVFSGAGRTGAAPLQQIIHPPPVNPFTDPQEPFQPSSTPIRLDHRFMVWNSVAIIRNYNTEDDEEDIDVEFHDVNFHTAIHLRNQFSFTMAAVSTEAAIFACERDEDHPSKLFCLNFATWDTSKEWTVDLPKGENIKCIAIGTGWIIIATSINRLRLFSVGGVQKFIYDLPNQVVTMSGHDNLLFITCLHGVGINGNQSLSYSILKVQGFRLQPLISDIPLPLSQKSVLTWIGFTDEGTPVTYDSKDVLRILNGTLWSPFCCMKEYLNGPNNHFWVVGVSEASQNIRAIKCKGNKYPPTIPRPNLMLIDAKIPICELDTEKSQLEDSLLRTYLLNSVANKMEKKGFDVEEMKDEADRIIRENLMKLFALSSKGDRDFRAAEYVSLMPSSHSVQIAIKYASRLHRMALTERLTTIGRDKLDKEDIDEIDDCDFETQNKTNYIHISRINDSQSQNVSDSQDSFQINNHDSSSTSFSALRNSSLTLEENPLMKKQRDAIRAVVELHPVIPPSNSKNPFKKTKEINNVTKNGQEGNAEGGNKGIALIDAWKKLPDKPTMEFNPKNPLRKLTKKGEKDKDKETNGGGGRGKRKSDKDLTEGNNDSKKKKQRTLFDMQGAKSKDSGTIESNPSSPAVSALDEDSQQISSKQSDQDQSETEETQNNDTEDAMEDEDHEVQGREDDNSMDSTSNSSANRVIRHEEHSEDGESSGTKSRFASKLKLFEKRSEEQEETF